MPRVRADNDARYALRASFVDENGDILDTPVVIPAGVSGITATQISNWDTAYSWGDHSTQGYLTSFTETDPVFAASDASGISSSDISNWDTAYGWGDHSTEGYLTSFSETDPVFASSAAFSIGAGDVSNWNTAYGWGNHASAGYYVNAIGSNLSTNRITWANNEDTAVTADGHMAFDLNDTAAGATLGTYGSTDPSGWYFYSGGNVGRFWTDEHFTGTHVSNWQTAYGWGDHSSAGYLTSHQDISGKLNTSGGTLTGNLTVNARLDIGNGTGGDHEIRIYKGDNDVSDHIQFYNGTTRVGEIGCQDNTWLRINQVTAKNIYTPRYIRADNGFYVDGTTKGINGSGNFIGGTITGASDANVSNWDTAYSWGNHASAGYVTANSTVIVDKSAGGDWRFKSSGQIQSSSGSADALEVYADNTNDAFMTFHISGDHATNLGLDGGTNRLGYGGWSTGNNFYKFYSTQDFPDVARGITGQYGSFEIDGGATGGWEGYSIGGRAVFMHDNGTVSGLYNDVNNHWILKGTHNGRTDLMYAGSTKGYTYSSGWRVTGNLLATSDVYAYYSDRRLKDVVGAIERPLESIGAIETFYYTHNDKARELGYEGSERQVGVSAQSVKAVLPEVIGRAPIDDDGEGGSVTGEDYMTVKYERIVPLLIEGIKELTAELESVKTELRELKDKSDAI